MKNAFLIVGLIYISFLSAIGQNNESIKAKRQMESLDRGIVAVRKSPEEVFISWRLLGTDPAKTGFNLYRGNQKLNKKPLTLVTNYTDKTATDEVYTVKAVVKGKEESASASCKVWQQSFLKIPLNRPAGGTMEKEVVSNRPDQANRPAGNTPADNRTDQLLQDRHQYTYAPGDASVADLDGDGKAEIVYGSSAYDDNGEPLYTTGMGHGDAMHLSDLDPDIPGLEVWAVKETKGLGGVLHSAADGKILFSVPGEGDTGRGTAADIYPDHRGFEMWSSTSKGIYSVKGVKITDKVPSVNFRIYWDGDLQDELLDKSFIDDWDYVNHKPVRLLDASEFGGSSINGTKATPVISADILGDWREELILRGSDNASLLLFTTTIPTEYRLYTLMHDPVYRLGVAWQNVVYNQPPHLGFYIGDGLNNVPIPNIFTIKSPAISSK
ncbi:MAG: hypothetical protein Q7T72_01030 [Bacteroidales bacterium]|nr:hypothetical protein [Bacteroidales bacterium]MDP3002535.1 hypothetical protein [Bacteroidales bacterium]